MERSNTARDRRRAVRFQRLLRLVLEHDDATESAVSVDVSWTGAFVRIEGRRSMPAGLVLDLRYRDVELAYEVVASARVIRNVAQPSSLQRIPGIAVEFEGIACEQGLGPLRHFLMHVVGCHELIAWEYSSASVSGGPALFRPPPPAGEPRGQSARNVHAERLSPDRCVPEETQAIEDLLRDRLTPVDRRRQRRYPVHIDVTWFLDEDVPHSGRVLSVSQTGLFVQTDHALPAVGTRVLVRFPVDESPFHTVLKISGPIRRHWDPDLEALPGFGMGITTVDAAGRPGVFRFYLSRLAKRFEPRARAASKGFHYATVRQIR